MNEEHVTGGAFTLMVLILMLGCASIGSCTATMGIINDCEDFGKFEHKQNWYNCERVK